MTRRGEVLSGGAGKGGGGRAAVVGTTSGFGGGGGGRDDTSGEGALGVGMGRLVGSAIVRLAPSTRRVLRVR